MQQSQIEAIPKQEKDKRARFLSTLCPRNFSLAQSEVPTNKRQLKT